jgi:hypothetical protein
MITTKALEQNHLRGGNVIVSFEDNTTEVFDLADCRAQIHNLLPNLDLEGSELVGRENDGGEILLRDKAGNIWFVLPKESSSHIGHV